MKLNHSSEDARVRFEDVMHMLSTKRCTGAVQEIEGFFEGSVTEPIHKNMVMIKMRIEGIDSTILLNGIRGTPLTMLAPRQYADGYFEDIHGGMSRLPDERSLQIAADWFLGDERHEINNIERSKTEIRASVHGTKWHLTREPPIWTRLQNLIVTIGHQFHSVIQMKSKMS